MSSDKSSDFVKIAPTAPSKIAIAAKYRKNFSGALDSIANISKVGTCKISGIVVIVSKIGRTPKTDSATVAAETDAVTVATKVSAENFLCNSSMQKITPASGALKIAANPACIKNFAEKISDACAKLYADTCATE